MAMQTVLPAYPAYTPERCLKRSLVNAALLWLYTLQLLSTGAAASVQRLCCCCAGVDGHPRVQVLSRATV